MFFLRKSISKHLLNKNIIISSSLPEQLLEHSLTATEDTSHSFGRTALCAAQASLTVETAFVLPIFVFLSMCFLFFIEICSLHAEIQGGLFQAARGISNEMLVMRAVAGGDSEDSELATKIICVASARNQVLNFAKEKLENAHCLQGGKNGLDFMHSTIDGDMVDLIVSYRVKLPYSFGIDFSFPVIQRCRMHAWTGRSGTVTVSDKDGEMVYITENGTVYHKDRECSHIKLKIQTVLFQDVPDLRNQGGGKYYSCEKCAKDGISKERVYITSEGNKYHNSLSCSGLKRSVHMVSKDQAKGRSACIRCCK